MTKKIHLNFAPIRIIFKCNIQSGTAKHGNNNSINQEAGTANGLNISCCELGEKKGQIVLCVCVCVCYVYNLFCFFETKGYPNSRDMEP